MGAHRLPRVCPACAHLLMPRVCPACAHRLSGVCAPRVHIGCPAYAPARVCTSVAGLPSVCLACAH
eukprot:8491850-Pyramimonas_sp.AAC.3